MFFKMFFVREHIKTIIFTKKLTYQNDIKLKIKNNLKQKILFFSRTFLKCNLKQPPSVMIFNILKYPNSIRTIG